MNKYTVELTDTHIRVLQALGVQVNTFKENKPKIWKPKVRKPIIWKPPMGVYFFTTLHQINDVWDKSLAKQGVHRNTKEACELASERMLKTNLISAWAHEYGGEEEWEYGKEQYYVLQNDAGEWHIGNAAIHCNHSTVYMTKECALAMCDALNSGEFILS